MMAASLPSLAGLVEEPEERVCRQEETYAVAIPVEMGIHDAMDLCQKKLNNSIIPYQKGKGSLKI